MAVGTIGATSFGAEQLPSRSFPSTRNQYNKHNLSAKNASRTWQKKTQPPAIDGHVWGRNDGGDIFLGLATCRFRSPWIFRLGARGSGGARVFSSMELPFVQVESVPRLSNFSQLFPKVVLYKKTLYLLPKAGAGGAKRPNERETFPQLPSAPFGLANKIEGNGGR